MFHILTTYVCIKSNLERTRFILLYLASDHKPSSNVTVATCTQLFNIV